jgi:hypothetical protein
MGERLVRGPRRFLIGATCALVTLLFGCGHNAAPAPVDSDPASSAALGPAPGRRLTKGEYANSIADLLGVALDDGDRYLLPDDEPATGGGFRDDIAALLPSAVRTDAYERLAASVAARVAWAGGLAAHAACTDPTAACREGFIRHLGRLVYRRPLTDADVQLLEPVFGAAVTASEAAATFEDGARLVLQAMLQSPHFLYRLERGDAFDPRAGRPAPSPFELATRLSYLLWASAPGSGLLDAAERGELSGGRDALARVVDGMLGDARARRGLDAYAQDWLQLYRLDARTPNDALGVSGDLLAEMKQESMRLVERIAIDEGRDLTDILTDKRTDVGPALAQVYGIDPVSPAVVSPSVASYDLSNDPNRLGILTQPGFLILRAAPAHVSIVDRGLMVMRVFLCQEMPAPPPGAAAQIDSIPTDLTDRDRFALHTAAPECAGCHDAFDPLGYPFEPFDFAGRFRTVDDYGNPLRNDGQVMLDGTLQSYADTASFAALLAASPTVQRCLVSKLYQYGMGRSLRDGDSAAVDQIAQAFADGGRTWAAAVTAVATSPALRAMGVAP